MAATFPSPDRRMTRPSKSELISLPSSKNSVLDKDEEGKLFLQLSRANGSKVDGELHEAAVRLYDSKGKFVRESAMKIKTGNFGESPLQVNTVIRHFGQK